MNRKKELENAAQNMEEELFASQYRRLEKEYRNKELRCKAVEAFSQIFSLAADKQKELSWLGICYLHTSLTTGSHEILLSLYNKEFYFDPAPVEMYWRPPCFFDCFEEDMESVMKGLRSQFPRIWGYEEEFVRRFCVEYYYAATHQLCIDLAGEIMGTEAFRKAAKAENFTAFFGRYQGEGEILWRIKEA
ncbi:hypothetical protein [Lacrimispora sp.]|uniref:hypothetical protein n=1 Tax=Lacrimispora sp. TaxID=2719234 RepID=UPI002858F891|nr:hypothetical protein [Lacrimispora sp.]MDR7810478.1 hypothetical protein [Lacrimispora sp.]